MGSKRGEAEAVDALTAHFKPKLSLLKMFYGPEAIVSQLPVPF
jgi:hypothetical protein